MMELYTLYSQQAGEHHKERNRVESSSGEAEVIDDKADENSANHDDADMRMTNSLSTQTHMTSIASLHSNNTQQCGEPQVVYYYSVGHFLTKIGSF